MEEKRVERNWWLHVGLAGDVAGIKTVEYRNAKFPAVSDTDALTKAGERLRAIVKGTDASWVIAILFPAMPRPGERELTTQDLFRLRARAATPSAILAANPGELFVRGYGPDSIREIEKNKD